MSKKKIIAIVSIIVLLFAAGISVGIFLYGRGETEATDGNQTTDGTHQTVNENQSTDGTPTEEDTSNPNDGNTGVPGEDNTGEEGNGTVENDNQNTNNENVTGNTPSGNAGVTTDTNVNDVGETTITRVEEQERLVSEGFWDWWQPMQVAITPTQVGLEIPQITVEKTAVVDGMIKDLVYAGQDLTYIIAVTNNGETSVENIEITDRIPENTTYINESIEDAFILKLVDGQFEKEIVEGSQKTIVQNQENEVIGLKWIVTIPAKETVFVSFKVNVNKTMLDINNEELATNGTIYNMAIANGEESNETKTSIIKTSKSSVITRNENEVKIAKIGDLIKYTITVENTGDVEGTTIVKDTVPEGTEFISAQEGAIVSEEQDSVEWELTVPANETTTREFTVKVVNVNGEIKNIATVGDVPTEEDIVDTTEIDVEKVVTDIKRDGLSIGIDAKVQVGDVIEYKMTVTNKGSKDLTNVVVDEKLEGITINTGSLEIGDLKAGETVEILATYTVTYEADIKKQDGKIIINEVYVSGETIPEEDETPEKVEDEDETKTPVEDAPSVQIEKTATAVNGEKIKETTKVRPGDVIEYTITVENTGNTTLTNIVVTDTLNVSYNNENKAVGEIIETIETLEPKAQPVEIKVYYEVTEADCAELQKIKNVATATSSNGTTDEDDDETVNVNEDTSVTITKIWDDANNQDGKRPETITINLYADGVFVKSETISGTTYTFEKLPTYNESGEKIVYTVTENTVAEYITSYSSDTLTIINTHTPEMISAILVTKSWNDNNDQDGIRPESVSVSLLEDGTIIRTIEITKNNNWVASFENLPVYKNGKIINYTVIENNVPEGYTAQVSGSVETGMTITNTHITATTEVTAIKTWNDNNDQDGIRPETVEITLYADGIEKQTETVNAESNWTATFTNLPKYRDGGIEIVYTVDEKIVAEGYTKLVNGNTITNTHAPAITEVTATKIWEDSDDQDGKRPTSVQITLYADGEEKQTLTANAESNWKVTFTNLPKYKNGGKLIVYTIDEKVVAEGYTKSINGNTITNQYIPETTEVTATKVWEDSNNQDGIRPASVEITLYADGEEKQTLTANAESNWKVTFTNLPKYKNGGKLIVYTIDEKVVANGYTKTVNGNTITNAHTPETTEVIATKVWKDADNQDGIRPELVQITLYADGKEKQTAMANAESNWTATFTNLPKYKDAGIEIVYTIDEKVVAEGYTKSINGNTITNTHIPSVTEVTVTKKWVDENNQDGIRPQSINVSLLANGTVKQTVDITAENNWTYTFKNLFENANGQKINYTVVENTVVPGYSSVVNGFEITNTHNTEKTSITAAKVWNDADNQDGIRPESVELTLYANGIEKQTVTVNAENEWKYTFTDLPVNENGTEIVYTVDEKVVVEKYTKSINGYTVTNTYVPETTEVTATKVWNDANNQDGIRPESIEITLYADGEEKQTLTANAESNWTATFTNLPKYKNGGKLIVYTIDEKVVANAYTKTVNGNTITNTYVPEKTEVTATKVWEDANNQDGIRPTSVDITLYADGEEKQTLTANAENNWKVTFTNLPKYRDGGIEIVYTIDEKVVTEGYTKTVNGKTITNTHTPETTEVTVIKVWEDTNNQDGLRPKTINVSLLANGAVKESVNLTAVSNWTYTFANLDKKSNGIDINYTVVENNIPTGYAAVISGDMNSVYKITNTHQIEKTSVKVNKVWNDANNQDGIRPASISVSLMDGTTVVDTQELSDANNWEYVFTDLDKKANGEIINYTVVENNIPTGYAAEVTGNITSGYTITNTHQVEKTSVKVKKVWNDTNNQDGMRTPVISVSLMNGTTVVATQNLSDSNNWEYTFTNLDKKANGEIINYTVVENSIPTGYTATITGDMSTGYIITNTHQVEKTSVKVNKVWNDGNNQDGIRPSSISVNLMNGTTIVKTQELSSSNNWEYTFTDLDKKANGVDINYTVVENNISTGYTSVISGSMGDGFVITNTHTPEKIDIPVIKQWDDNNNYYNARTSVTIDLKVGNTTIETITISEADGWRKIFTNLPKYENGQEIQYIVSERPVTGYTTKNITGDKSNGFTITNTYNNVTVNKKTLTSTEITEGTENVNVDVVFVLDTSGSMTENNKYITMINALNNAMGTILQNSNNRVGVVGYSDNYYGDSNSTVLLELGHYTAKETGKYFKTSSSWGNTLIKTNVNEKTTQSQRYVRGATYTQIGIKEGARLLTQASNTNTSNRTPVIILLTDGEPTRHTTSYAAVADYTDGDGTENSITANSAYYTILSAKHYKQQVDNKYADTSAQFYTIGIGMDENDKYQNILLNPNQANVNIAKSSTGKVKEIYNKLSGNYIANGGTKTNFDNDLNYYSYANGSYLGEMNETQLNAILTEITENITKYYATTTTKTTNVNTTPSKIELTNLDINQKITIVLDGTSNEYTVTALMENSTITLESGKYYMNLNATMFNNIKTIDITYYEAEVEE